MPTRSISATTSDSVHTVLIDATSTPTCLIVDKLEQTVVMKRFMFRVLIKFCLTFCIIKKVNFTNLTDTGQSLQSTYADKTGIKAPVILRSMRQPETYNLAEQ